MKRHVLVSVRPETLDQTFPRRYDAAAEFVAAQRTNDDRPESRTNPAPCRPRAPAAAETERAALALDPTFVPALNLADIYRVEQREPDVRRARGD